MASPHAPEPEQILRAAVEDPGEATLGELARQAGQVQGILETLEEDELRRSYAVLARIVGGQEKGEAPEAGGGAHRALSAVLDRMRRAAPPPAEDRPRPPPDSARKASRTERPAGKRAAAQPPPDGPTTAPPDGPPASDDAALSSAPDAPAPPPDRRVALLDVPGRAVPLGALAEVPGLDGELLLAPTLLRLLHAAAGSSEALDLPAPHDPEARARVITPAAFLAAALAEGEGERSPYSVTGALRARMETRAALPAALALDPAAADGAEILVGPELRGILARAAGLAAELRGASTAPGRKFALAALVLTAAGRQAFADLGMPADAPGPFFADLASWLSEWLAEDDARHDRRDWAGWFAANPPPGAEALLAGLDLRLPVRLSAPDYAADDVARRRGAPGAMLEGDRLGVAADARALADLVCLEAARPPLAIGLFGPWGSGKSTFMRMIEEAAEANRATAAKMREAGAVPPFVENIAHVWFNAWHYLDANLWASLVSHIFRELHRLSRGASPEEARRMDYLVEKLASAAQAETAAREGVRAADDSVRTAERRVAEADLRLDDLRRKLAEAAPRALDDLLAEETRKGLAALEAAGVSVPLRSLAQLRELRRELSGLGGRLRLLGSAIGRGGPRTWGALAAAGAVLAAGGLGAAWLGRGEGALAPWLAAFLADAAGALGLAGALAAAVAPHVGRVRAALDAVAAAEEEARETLAEAEAERGRMQAELARLEAERLRAQDDLDARRRERARLEAMRRGEQPAELLAQFIEERARADGYRRHLGLLSQIRADFELMADLLAPRSPDAKAAAARRIRADPAELPRIGRIVLYIDDLDRCRDAQVVEVLEAIHLLLAFDLFVVVVGVDARWVEGALSRFYDQQLGPAGTRDGRPGVADYLEKIFQVPFRLRPMEVGEGGGYARLVAEIVGPVQTDPGGRAPDAPDPEAAPREAAGPAGPPPLPAIDLSAVWPARETPAQVMERVTLTRPELEAIQALGPLVGRSPRTAKRFVNLYRLLRARRRGEALEAFLEGEDGHAAPFRGALFWLALETGLDARQAALLTEAMGGDPVWSWRELLDAQRPAPPQVLGDASPPEDVRDAIRRRRAFWDSIDSPERRQLLAEGFETLDSVWPDFRAGLVGEAARYSFRFGGRL